MYDAIIYIYALSLLFYFSDFIGANRSAKRMGTGLLVFVWVLQTAYLGLSVYNHVDRAYAMSETLFLFSWLLVTVSLIINRFFRIELFVFLVNVVGFSVLALNIFSNPRVTPMLGRWEVSDELLFIHITLAVGSYAAFVIAAVFSGMYLFLHRQLKEKHWSVTMKRLPSLEKTDRYAYRAVIAGTPLLITALSLGLIWVVLQGSAEQLGDLKVLNSLLVLVGYLYYLFLRLSVKANGRRLAIWNLYAFGVVLLNFIFTNWLSGFHQWVWM
ncbi:cytochrome C assembly family protein [Paenibacillus aurantius]|nr:cytochrome c biogenesis protein CcsA [Paenibacillus aurantius]